jgi:hypothetical protein
MQRSLTRAMTSHNPRLAQTPDRPMTVKRPTSELECALRCLALSQLDQSPSSRDTLDDLLPPITGLLSDARPSVSQCCLFGLRLSGGAI